MNWNRAVKISGFLASTVCGACLAKTCTKTDGLFGSVVAEEVEHQDQVEDEQKSKLSGLTLKQVHVYFRHGARTPIHVIPGLEEVAYWQDMMLRTPPHLTFKHQVVLLPELRPREGSEYEEHYKRTPLKGGGYAGNLTTYGQQQMYSLGLRLRQAYVEARDFLSDGYHPEDVFVQSTNINRTIASARCVMAGLFGKEHLNKKGPIIIPVYTFEEEILIPNRRACPVLRKIHTSTWHQCDSIPGVTQDREHLEKVLGPVTIPVSTSKDEILFPNSHICSVVRKANHAAMLHFDNIPGMQEDREFIESLIGYNCDAKLNFVSLRDDLIARQTHGYSIPEHIRPYMEMIEKNATKILYFAMCGQHDAERPIVTRLAAGPALNRMLQGMESVRQGHKTHKLCLYSTHDSTTVALLEALGLFDWKWPPFSADLRLELYEDRTGGHWVRVLYLGQEKTVRGCSGPVCRFTEFKENLMPYIISRGAEFDKICASQILEQIAASLVQHDKDEVETPEMKEISETPAGM